MNAIVLAALLASSDLISRECAATGAQKLAMAMSDSYSRALDEVLADDPLKRVEIKRAALRNFTVIKIDRPECMRNENHE